MRGVPLFRRRRVERARPFGKVDSNRRLETRLRREESALEHIPPELVVIAEPIGRDEKGRRYAERRQNRRRLRVVVDIPIIERHGNAAWRDATVARGRDEILERQRPIAADEMLHMRAE